MENNELQHHGIRGMKWGVRRYQNKDGTLTPRGKKRYAAEMEKLKKEEQVLKNRQKTQAKIDRLLKKEQELEDLKKKLSGKTDSDESTDTTAKTSKTESKTSNRNKYDLDSLSDKELSDIVNRLQNEKKYKAYVKEMEAAQVSRGKKFVDKVMNDMIIPAASEVGKQMAKDILSDLADKVKPKK